MTGAIIGLGNIGFGFNSDRRRSGVWTHERAFRASGAVRLIGAVDPAPRQRARFARGRPDVPVFSSVSELLRRRVPDLVSICTPTATHARIAGRCVRGGVRAVFCEKPLAAATREAGPLLRLCRERGVALAVNHIRRWDPRFQRAARVIRGRGIGAVLSVSARYSGRVLNVGTHVIDAVRMLTGLTPLEAVGFSARPKEADPDVSGLLRMDGGVCCALSCHGRPADLLFEIDVVGSSGRLRIVDNGLRTILERLEPSRRYAGYREFAPAPLSAARRGDRFIAAVRDICACLRRGGTPACTGEDGYLALAAAEALAASARRGSRPTRVRPPR